MISSRATTTAMATNRSVVPPPPLMKPPPLVKPPPPKPRPPPRLPPPTPRETPEWLPPPPRARAITGDADRPSKASQIAARCRRALLRARPSPREGPALEVEARAVGSIALSSALGRPLLPWAGLEVGAAAGAESRPRRALGPASRADRRRGGLQGLTTVGAEPRVGWVLAVARWAGERWGRQGSTAA